MSVQNVPVLFAVCRLNGTICGGRAGLLNLKMSVDDMMSYVFHMCIKFDIFVMRDVRVRKAE